MIDYKVIRSKRRTMVMEITSGGEVVVRAPKSYSPEEIDDFVRSKESWVQKHLSKLAKRQEEFKETGQSVDSLSESELRALTNEARKEFRNLVNKWEPVVFGKKRSPVGIPERQISIFDLGLENVAPDSDFESRVGHITIRHQSSRWGSCSKKGNLNFNCLLMLAPAEVRDYVVVHELCHLLHMNHSKSFWREVARVMPNYRQPYNWLKENGGLLLARLDK